MNQPTPFDESVQPTNRRLNAPVGFHWTDEDVTFEKNQKPTSRARKARAVKDEATRLHSTLTRQMKGPWCQDGCGRRATDAAHIVGRSFAHTRTDLDNALALAAECHRHYTNWPGDWLSFLDGLIGRNEYDRLCTKAREGVGQKFDWYAELDRLRALATQLEVDA